MICYECNKEKVVPHDHDHNMVCEECFREKYFTCQSCEEVYSKDDVVCPTDGSMLCEDCYNKDWIKCSSCREEVHVDDSKCAYDETYCESCYDNHFTYVVCCQEPIPNDDVYFGDGNAYCENHYHELFGNCENCGDSFSNNDLYYNEEESNYYCERCYNKGIIHDYSYKPTPVFAKMPYENTVYLGIELEVENKGSLNDKSERLMGFLGNNMLEDRIYLKWAQVKLQRLL